MQTFSTTGKIGSDGHLHIDIPTQLPEGEVSILVVVENSTAPHPAPPTHQHPYPLRGKVIHYNDPTEPVAEDEWDVMK